MVVYAELVFFENFAIDYIIMLLAGKFTKISPKRPWLGGIIGAVYATVMPLAEFLSSPFIIGGVLILMVILSFPKSKLIQICELLLSSVCVSGMFYGIVFLVSRDYLQNNFFYSDDVIFYIALGSVLLGIVSLKTLEPFFRETHFNEKTVVLSYCGKSFEALIDTGNSLYYNGKPVILVKKDVICEENSFPLIIPYTSVGKSGALLGFNAENVTVKKGDVTRTFSCVIAICDNGFGKNYSALMHPDLLGDVV